MCCTKHYYYYDHVCEKDQNQTHRKQCFNYLNSIFGLAAELLHRLLLLVYSLDLHCELCLQTEEVHLALTLISCLCLQTMYAHVDRV